MKISSKKEPLLKPKVKAGKVKKIGASIRSSKPKGKINSLADRLFKSNPINGASRKSIG